jgi:epoxyqueuosine reductase QueG
VEQLPSLTTKVKNFAKARGATLVGIAPIQKLSKAPTGHQPKDFLPNAKNLISIALKINKLSILQLPKTMKEYKLSYDIANFKLNSIACETAGFLEDESYEAVAIPASKPYDNEKLVGDISHKHVAVAAGLGRFGLNNLILTREYGPYVRFVTVITNALLDPDKPLDKDVCLGEECSKCVKACPAEALKNPICNPEEGWRINKEKCYQYIHTISGGEVCGLCIKACTAYSH